MILQRNSPLAKWEAKQPKNQQQKKSYTDYVHYEGIKQILVFQFVRLKRFLSLIFFSFSSAVLLQPRLNNEREIPYEKPHSLKNALIYECGTENVFFFFAFLRSFIFVVCSEMIFPSFAISTPYNILFTQNIFQTDSI